METATLMDISENEKNSEQAMNGSGGPSMEVSEDSTQETLLKKVDGEPVVQEVEQAQPQEKDMCDDPVSVLKDSTQADETRNVKTRAKRKRESESSANDGNSNAEEDGVKPARILKLLTPETMKEVVDFILAKCTQKNGEPVPAFGTLTRAADQFGIPKSTIRHVWERAKRKAASNSTDNTIQPHHFQTPISQRHNCGRKKKWNREQVSQLIVELPFQQRKSVNQAGEALNIPYSTLHHMFAYEKLVPTSSSTSKPEITEQNKYFRLLYAVERIRRNQQGSLEYDLAANEVHLDERWFHITAKKDPDINNNTQSPGETKESSNNLPMQKVMFLTAVARPRFDRKGSCTFDGKIGMWSFVQKHLPETKTNQAETKQDVYLSHVLEKVIPAIQQKWPTSPNTSVVRVALQHDNALSHFHKEHEKWKELVARHKDARPIQWHFSLNEQPANSPETNVLHYRYLPRLELCQSIINSPAHPNCEELIAGVKSVWDNYLPMELNHDFLTHQACLDEIIACHGDNDFNIPQWGKEQEKKQVIGKPPLVLPVSDKARHVLQYVGFPMEEFPDFPCLCFEQLLL